MADFLARADVVKAFEDVLDCDFPYVSEFTPRERIEEIWPANVYSADHVSRKVDDLIDMLDAMNERGEIPYSAYSALWDAANEIEDDPIGKMEEPMNNTLKVKLDPGAFAPVRAHEDDAGLGLISPVDVNIWTKGREAICTGVHVQIPKGYVGMITAKPGLMRDHGIITTGTIDAGYTGPINVVLFNTGDHIFSVKRGMKIAQLVIKQIITPQIEIVDELEETERGDGGFGSTGSMAKEVTDGNV